MTNNVKLLSALLVGAAAGTVLGVLFAPDKGSATRKKISKRTQDLIDQLSDKVEEGKSTLADFKKKAMDTADDIRSGSMEENDNSHSRKHKASHSSN